MPWARTQGLGVATKGAFDFKTHPLPHNLDNHAQWPCLLPGFLWKLHERMYVHCLAQQRWVCLLSQLKFTRCLLCASHGSKHLSYGSKQTKIPALVELTLGFFLLPQMANRQNRYMDGKRELISFYFALSFLLEGKIERKRAKEWRRKGTDMPTSLLPPPTHTRMHKRTILCPDLWPRSPTVWAILPRLSSPLASLWPKEDISETSESGRKARSGIY